MRGEMNPTGTEILNSATLVIGLGPPLCGRPMSARIGIAGLTGAASPVTDREAEARAPRTVTPFARVAIKSEAMAT